MPFAMLEPVHVGGVTVSTATLHNEEDLARKDVRVGDEVVVKRAGDVIPQVVAPLTQRRKKGERKPKPPKKCPACGTPTVKPEGAVFTICPNRSGCPGQPSSRSSTSSAAARWTSTGWARSLRCASSRKVIADVADLYELDEKQSPASRASARVRRQPGRGDRPLARAAVHPGALRARAPGVGEVNARRWLTTSARSTRCASAEPEQIEEVEGVGSIMAVQIAESLADEPTGS